MTLQVLSTHIDFHLCTRYLVLFTVGWLLSLCYVCKSQQHMDVTSHPNTLAVPYTQTLFNHCPSTFEMENWDQIICLSPQI